MENKGKHFNCKRNTFKKNILTLLFLIFLIMLIVSGTQLVKWYMNNRKNQGIINEIKSENIVVYDEDNDEISVDFEALKEINSQVVGYIEVNNTDISYPIVQASDNDYYLTRNLKKEYNSAGWIFLDYRNKLDGTDKNIIIYGHNMRDGSMFGTLKKVLTSEWYNNEENKYITFITEEGNMTYEVFSVYQIEKEDYYIQTSFSSDEKYEEFLDTIASRSINDFGVEVGAEDTILTLSTCANNNAYRVVLHAKLIN